MLTHNAASSPVFGKRSHGYNPNDTRLMALALIWPFAGAVLSFFMLHRGVARFVLVAVLVLIGSRLVLEDQRFDAYRLSEYARTMAELNLTGFYAWFREYCFTTEQCIDPVQPVYTFLLTRLSSSPSFAYAGYSLLFALFSVSTLAALRIDKRNSGDYIYFYFFLFAVMASNPIYHVGGFRFNSASWSVLLGWYLIFYRNRDVGFLFIFLAVCTHYSMLFFLILSGILRFVILRPKLCVMLAIGSFFLSASASLLVPYFVGGSEFGAMMRAARYVSEAALENRALGMQQALSTNLFFTYFAGVGLKFVFAMWMVYLFISAKLIQRMNAPQARFLSCALLVFAASNLISEIPSAGRFLNISIQLLFMSFIVCADIYDKKEKFIFVFLFFPVFLFSILGSIRLGLGIVDVFSILPIFTFILPSEAFL